ncbi:hypothetical protein [Microbulbifer rhizosphaerae]|uniref:Outer membrane murein-binding lipoprotein Lpp n=1 Tax=Microbulbifer rhizosphaerae TaxID=1562603 RepID=A0A7W4ZB35_9GAMM|nr:hypothetical protein [Microbulbifer rhizosphaerae]MBB3063206.1 outer membrane murein-binding lipoprotein Lpp [Microbulbifer rhizosphaerae]
MRQFSILVVFALAFGGAAVLYEQESRKVKGVLTQITELQAQLGDLQAEVNRLSAELEATKLTERRRPGLKSMASRVLRDEKPADKPAVQVRDSSGKLIASDVTSAPPAIRGRGEDPDEDEWNRPTMDAEQYQPESAGSQSEQAVADPYQ